MKMMMPNCPDNLQSLFDSVGITIMTVGTSRTAINRSIAFGSWVAAVASVPASAPAVFFLFFDSEDNNYKTKKKKKQQHQTRMRSRK